MRTTAILFAIVGFATLSLGAPAGSSSLKQLLADKSKLIKKGGEATEGKLNTLIQTEDVGAPEAVLVPAPACRNCNSCDCCLPPLEPCADKACCNLCPDFDECDFKGHACESSEDCFETNQRICAAWVPDTLECTEEESVEAENEETVSASCAKGTKNRHFCINGDICVTESVSFNECSKSESKTDGNGCAASFEQTHGACSELPCQSCHTVCLKSPLDVNSVPSCPA
jgi:hypothetical protein